LPRRIRPLLASAELMPAFEGKADIGKKRTGRPGNPGTEFN
jgi:hypothetical protein